ncbi:hypothetical protein RhiJN_14691 [Ceratobasidium sp. AG-Ba]|nr:hypothetical protein RhiJN_14691 [Ceratobasidium sp. AG-Ba]QRW15230.1 hypothetical protein RhiLY_14229 [Ceratobasidium sp. AG-Ba]
MLDWSTESLAQKLSTESEYVATSVTAYTTVSPSRGFHITSSTSVSNFTTPLKACSTALLQLVPPNFIVDEYELDQRYKEGYGPLCHVVGEKDLELPVEAVGNRSALILAEFPVQDEIKIDIPLHLRYAKPQRDIESVELELPWPWVIVVCDQPKWDGRQFLHHLYENEPIGAYSVIAPALGTSHPSSLVTVPTGNVSHQFWVEVGTLLSVLLTFLYLSWCLFTSVRASSKKIKKT